MPRSSDDAFDYSQPRPVKQAHLAKMANRSRSTVSEACKGPLASACMPGGFVDCAQPAVALWAGVPREKLIRAAEIGDRRPLRSKPKPGPRPAEPKRAGSVPAERKLDAAEPRLVIDERAPSASVFAAAAAIPVERIGAEFGRAVIPVGHVSATEFAARASVDLAAVKDALRGALHAALTPAGRIDIGHPASLAYMAAHPFEETVEAHARAAEICDETAIELFASCCGVGDMVDLDHPCTRAFLARCWGKVPTDAEIDRALAAVRGTS